MKKLILTFLCVLLILMQSTNFTIVSASSLNMNELADQVAGSTVYIGGTSTAGTVVIKVYKPGETTPFHEGSAQVRPDHNYSYNFKLPDDITGKFKIVVESDYGTTDQTFNVIKDGTQSDGNKNTSPSATAVIKDEEGQKKDPAAIEGIKLVVDGIYRLLKTEPYEENSEILLPVVEINAILGPVFSGRFSGNTVSVSDIDKEYDLKASYNEENKTVIIGTKEGDEWWYRYPTSSDTAFASKTGSRVSQSITASDFGWGLYTQRISYNGSANKLLQDKAAGLKTVGYMEATGQPRTYAVAYNQLASGAFMNNFSTPPFAAQAAFNAWAWSDDRLQNANYITYTGIHSTVNNEDIVKPGYTMEALNHPVPTYPDGRDAYGYIADSLPYPLNARVYDAACNKNLLGDLNFELKMPYEGKITTGLAEIKVGSKWLPTYKGKNEGDSMYFRDLYFGKDTASPFWYDYNKAAASNIVNFGLDGAWFDNMSMWDNFRSLINMFGDWSEYKFNSFLKDNFTTDQLVDMGVTDPDNFNIREYILEKAREFGESSPENMSSAVYKSGKWFDDMIWNAYKIFKKDVGSQTLKDLYNNVKDAAKEAGLEEGFAVIGNDMPTLNHGWIQDGWLDIVGSELSEGWNQTFGTKGIQRPPVGKMAIMYRTMLEHQKGPYAIIWHYAGTTTGEVAGKVLLAEAFANNIFVKKADNTIGTEESHLWLNNFAEKVEEELSPRYLNYDIGIVFSSQDQLANSVPGDACKGPSMDNQYHVQGHWGFAQALVDAHIPYRTITDWKLDAKTLETVKTLILPNCEAIDDSVLPLLEKFVSDGGRLVVTGPAGLRKGFEGFFEKREKALLSGLVGRDISGAPGNDPESRLKNYDKGVYTNEYGEGIVVWTAEPIGHEYMINIDRRESILPAILEMTGESDLFDGNSLPFEAGSFLWKSTDGKNLYIDLVNYNLDIANDKVTPLSELNFRIKLPYGVKNCKVTVFSPDDETGAPAVTGAAVTATTSATANTVVTSGKGPKAAVKVKDGWAEITLDKLDIYASIKITPQEGGLLSAIGIADVSSAPWIWGVIAAVVVAVVALVVVKFTSVKRKKETVK